MRPLTYTEITEMSAADAEWHLRHNSENWKQAVDEQERMRNSKRHIAQNRVILQWQGHATDEENEAAIKTGNEFTKKFPQFEKTFANARLMSEYMQRENLPGTELSSYIMAFRALSDQGVLTLVKPESADKYLQNHPELRDTRIPPMIEKRQQVAAATAAHFEQAASSTAASGSTKVVDYEPEQRGPLYANTNKASFRNLLKNLSADEYLEKMQDPQFSAAVDNLEEK